MAEEGSIRGAWPGLAEEEWGRDFSYGEKQGAPFGTPCFGNGSFNLRYAAQKETAYCMGLMRTSTRRFCWRPYSVLLSAMGELSP